MKTKIQPVVTNPFAGETACYVEVFSPGVVPARPAIAEIPAVTEGPANDRRPLTPAVAAFPGTVSLIARFYDADGNGIGLPVRNNKTELTADQYTQWSQWPNGIDDDAAFFTDCVITNLGLTKA